MEPSILIHGLGLAGVVTAMILDFRADERGARTGHARARTAGPEQRCPFCHQGFAAVEEKVRCASCATGHHAACWSEHPRCSIFGCGSEDLREAVVGEPETEAVVPEASAEPEAAPDLEAEPRAEVTAGPPEDNFASRRSSAPPAAFVGRHNTRIAGHSSCLASNADASPRG